jgi:hypothetical protein
MRAFGSWKSRKNATETQGKHPAVTAARSMAPTAISHAAVAAEAKSLWQRTLRRGEPRLRGEVVGQQPECLVAAQRAYGAEVAAVECADRVRVVAGGDPRSPRRRGRGPVRCSGPDGLGGTQVVLRDLWYDNAAPAHPVPDAVDRAEGAPRPSSRVVTWLRSAEIGEEERVAGPNIRAMVVAELYRRIPPPVLGCQRATTADPLSTHPQPRISLGHSSRCGRRP